MPHDSDHCKNCRRAGADHGTRCTKCARKRRREAAQLRKHRRKHGLCLTCGKRAAKDRAHCKVHLAYYRERFRARAA